MNPSREIRMSSSVHCAHCSRTFPAPASAQAASTGCPRCGAAVAPAPGPDAAWWVGHPQASVAEPVSPPAPVQPDAITADAPQAIPDWITESPVAPTPAPTPSWWTGPAGQDISAAPALSAAPLAAISGKKLLAWGAALTLLLVAGGAIVAHLALPNKEPSADATQTASLEPSEPEATPAPSRSLSPEPASAPRRDEPETPDTSVAPPTLIPYTRPPVELAPVRQDPAPAEPVAQTPTPAPAPEVRPEVRPEPAAPAPAPFLYRRHSRLTEEDLLRQVVKAPEVALDRTASRAESLAVLAACKAAHQQGKVADVTPVAARKRPDLAGLPLAMGEECRMSPTLADHLQGGSVALRAHLLVAARGNNVGVVLAGNDPRPDPRLLHNALSQDGDRHNKWLRPEAIPALQQLLMAENQQVRGVLVDMLARIPGTKATQALAGRAIHDLDPAVREAALRALADRPREEYTTILMKGLRHPWAPVADHAAEALATLRLKDRVPELVRLLDQPDPSLPFHDPESKRWYTREMVRVNHFRNCLLCHPASFDSQDKVRGPIPSTDRPLNATSVYGMQSEFFVRADITYLRQDFSAQLPVARHGPWPAVQRFDFVVRQRLATKKELPRADQDRPASDHQKAIFFALRELTGMDPGPTAEDWKRAFQARGGEPEKVVLAVERGSALAVGPAALYVGDLGAGTLWKASPPGEPRALLEGQEACSDLDLDPEGSLVACQPALKRIVVIDPETKKVRVAADRHAGGALLGPHSLCVDRQGGLYFTDVDPGSDLGRLYYLSAQGTVTHLACPLPRPRGVALAPDGRTLYVSGAGTREVWALPLESAGNPTAGRVLCLLDAAPSGEQGAPDLAVDACGRLHIPCPGLKAVLIFNSAGARLDRVDVPEAPLSCACRRDGQESLYILSATAVHRVALLGAGPG